MTQLAALALPGQEIDFELEVCKPDGTSYQPRRIFNDSDPDKVGWHDGIDSVIELGGACKGVSFMGRKDLVACEDADIVKFRVNDGYGWQAAGFGTLTTGHAAASLESYGNLIRSYEANTEELLKASVIIGTESYPPQDVAAIARQLTLKYRHPALGYDAALMPNVGVRLDKPSDFAGATLLKALDELAKKLQEVNGQTITYGVQADGKVFFKFPTGEADIAYDPDTYKELPIDLKDLCNAVYWVVGDDPSFENWEGQYQPGMLAYLSVVDPVRYTQNPRIKGLQSVDAPFVPVGATLSSSSGFTNPQYAVDSNASGNPILAQVATRNSGETGSLVIAPTYEAATKTYRAKGLPVYGAKVRYRRDYTSTGAFLQFYFNARPTDGSAGIGAVCRIPLPFSDNVYTEKFYKLPPPAEFDYAFGDTERHYIPEGNFYAVQVSVNLEGTFFLSDLRYLCLDTPALDAAAKLEAKTPAQNPAQLQPTYERGGLPVGRFIGNVATIRHTGRPDGTKRLPVSEIRHSYNREGGYQCAVDVGNPTREGGEATLERVASAIENRARESELRLGGRL